MFLIFLEIIFFYKKFLPSFGLFNIYAEIIEQMGWVNFALYIWKAIYRKMLAIISVEVFAVPILCQLSSLASMVTLISPWNLFDSSVHEMLASGENYESSSSR
jgi:hypothetical protein